MTILGITLDKNGGFHRHNTKVLGDLRKRLGMIRQLSVQLPQGKLLKEIGHSLIVGRLQSSAFETPVARINPADSLHHPQPNEGPAQVVLTDLARMLLGVRRTEHIRAADLVDRVGIPTVNEIVVRQSAVMAWRACKCNALKEVLEGYDGRTRGATGDLRKAISRRCLPAVNMCHAWNTSEALRKAGSIAAARSIAKKISKEARHA